MLLFSASKSISSLVSYNGSKVGFLVGIFRKFLLLVLCGFTFLTLPFLPLANADEAKDDVALITGSLPKEVGLVRGEIISEIIHPDYEDSDSSTEDQEEDQETAGLVEVKKSYYENYLIEEDTRIDALLASLKGEVHDGDVIDDLLKDAHNLSAVSFDDGFFYDESKRRYQNSKARIDKNTAAPILSDTTIYNMRRAIRKYANLVRQGGWGVLDQKEVPIYGEQKDSVYWLRYRFVKSGDLEPGYLNSDVFDSFLKRAVQKFQQRHGIKSSGAIDSITLEALNVAASKRLQQLKINLLRLKRHGGRDNKKYVLVNIPAAHVEAVDDNKLKSIHRAVVGKIKRKTPILSSKITSVNFNPKWHIPRSIIVRDLIPVVRRRPGYLERMGIRVYDERNKELQSDEVNWYDSAVEKYSYRQDPSRVNSLGLVKIHFPNKYSVFLHDTPVKSVFNNLSRAYSSGCVRVQNIRQLIYFLLSDNQGWTKEKVDEYLRNGKRFDVILKGKIPIFMAYITAWADAYGTVQFRNDLYNRDGVEYLVSNQQISS